MDDEEFAAAVVGTLSQEVIDEQRRQWAQIERQREGQASQSTRAVDWVENYADDPDDPCCPDEASSSAAQDRSWAWSSVE